MTVSSALATSASIVLPSTSTVPVRTGGASDWTVEVMVMVVEGAEGSFGLADSACELASCAAICETEGKVRPDESGAAIKVLDYALRTGVCGYKLQAVGQSILHAQAIEQDIAHTVDGDGKDEALAWQDSLVIGDNLNLEGLN